MELLQLRYFIELANRENLTKTAEKLIISPPSLSSTIRKLEKEIGVPLFDRTHYTIRLNNNGRIFYHYIKIALNAIDYGTISLSSQRKETLKLSLTNFPIWSELIYEFENQHPDIKVEYSMISLAEINDQSKPFLWDFFLGVIEDVDDCLFESRKSYSPEKPVVLMSVHHPLAKRAQIRLEELKNDDFISTKMVNASAHKYMESLCKIAGFEPKITYYADYLMRNKLLEQNRGVNIATMVGWNKTTIQCDAITVVPISYPSITRTQSVSWRKDRLLSALDIEFIEFATSYYMSHPLTGSDKIQEITTLD